MLFQLKSKLHQKALLSASRSTAIAVLVLVLSLVVGGRVQAQMFLLPPAGDDVIGAIRYTEAKQADTLLDIARRNDLGYEEIRSANPSVDTWLPGNGTRVVLPMRYILPNAPREGIVVNVAEMRLYYYPKPQAGHAPVVETFPISIGRANWSTPITLTRVTAKITDPVWYPTASIRAEHAADGDPLPSRIDAGEDNPLGLYALRLSLADYLIHGTNKAFGIGMQVTHGCIRLYPEDIAKLFASVPVGTPVRIVNQPYKSGWHNGELYLEVHPLLDGTNMEARHDKTPLVQTLIDATSLRPRYPINWRKTQIVAREQNGIPVSVGPPLTTADEEALRDNP
jgi:L,D-transpeptidase ErfK/SrfK